MTTPPQPDACGNCRFFITGHCRRHAPVLVPNIITGMEREIPRTANLADHAILATDNPNAWQFPRVSPGDWCGDFESGATDDAIATEAHHDTIEPSDDAGVTSTPQASRRTPTRRHAMPIVSFDQQPQI